MVCYQPSRGAAHSLLPAIEIIAGLIHSRRGVLSGARVLSGIRVGSVGRATNRHRIIGCRHFPMETPVFGDNCLPTFEEISSQCILCFWDRKVSHV